MRSLNIYTVNQPHIDRTTYGQDKVRAICRKEDINKADEPNGDNQSHPNHCSFKKNLLIIFGLFILSILIGSTTSTYKYPFYDFFYQSDKLHCSAILLKGERSGKKIH